MQAPTIRRFRLHRCAAALALLGVLSACAMANPFDASESPGPVFVDGDPGATRQDAASILQARIQGDRLMVQVQFGGGCRDHRFALYRENVFLESLPVQLQLHLTHDAQGDACRALLSRELTFDLTAVREAYRKHYGERGPLMLRLHAPGAGQPTGPALRYEF